ncbi:hypothetical protein BDV96DRAFT_562408 [Lophiotrema nucula]|uniref:VOC domain-containing protein n=1 Tax=Lophiotrema nucula TaxID=690887 RepID=A0A6A5ZQ61_9PLEO|nr:hypothetical protein BDV96DRAFT_562408 [Lophiotrema nucula]
MPVSHIGLTVSHLPTSCSFFLSALQPLGYRFIGQQGNQIGLGIHDADFFLCQETPGVKAGAAHIAFTAPSRIAVRDFYTAALTAGGRPNGAPASRTDDSDHFNAAVLDFDGNSIEVVFRNEPDLLDDGTVIEHSRVLTWQRSVVESIRDDRSVVSSRASASTRKQALLPAATIVLSKAPSVISKASSMVRSVSEPVKVPQTQVVPAPSVTSNGDGAAKKIIGTLLGAAAGAAVAYAMVKSEEDSAKKESDFDAFLRAKALAADTKEQPKQRPALSLQDPQPIYDTPPKSIHRNISDTESQYYSSPRGEIRAIEAPPPRSYHAPTYVSVPPTQVVDRRAIEYIPAYSVAPSKAPSLHRSFTDPNVVAVAKPRSVAPSAAPSTLISSFVPDQVQRRSSEGSVASHQSSRSKAKSHHSHASRHTSKSRSRAPSPPPEPSKAASVIGSILGRDAASSASKKDIIDDLEIEDLDINDSDTVAPSDSISNAGSRRSHRSHRTSSRSGSVVSKNSYSSKHSHKSHRSRSKESHHSSSRKSHHSSHSKHSSRSRREDSPIAEEYHDVMQFMVPPTIVSEPSDASTVKPSKSSRVSVRKDSMMSGQYEGLFNGGGNRGERWGHGGHPAGTMVSLPIRGITQSMVEESRSSKSGKRSVASYAVGQS